jgi:SAM-dependent methyltransferase
MIRVLQGWDEIGQSYRSLLRRDLPIHARVEKNWDMDILRQVVQPLPRRTRFLDMGCSGLHTLSLLSALGFEPLRGIDLHLTLRERTRALRLALQRRGTRLAYRLRRGDLVRSPFRDRSFDAVTCISTMEHDVNTSALLEEARRLLAPDGLFFITTDYWEPAIEVPRDTRPFGLGWRVFSERDIHAFLGSARASGFELLDDETRIPPCSDACVSAFGLDYTFIAVCFRASRR